VIEKSQTNRQKEQIYVSFRQNFGTPSFETNIIPSLKHSTLYTCETKQNMAVEINK